MSTNHEHDGEDELQAARRTAHGLGQTGAAEQAEVAAEMAASSQARQEVEEVEALAARLKEAAREAPQPGPSPALREAVERRLAELEPAAGRAGGQGPARRRWRKRLTAMAVAAACLVALAVPVVRSMKFFDLGESREVAKQSVASAPLPAAAARETKAAKGQAMPEQFDRTDVGEIEESPPTEMDTDPTLEKPGQASQDAEYKDDSRVFEHRAGGMASGSKDMTSHGVMAFGPGPKVTGALGVGVGVGTGKQWGSGGSGDGGSSYGAPQRDANAVRPDVVVRDSVVYDDLPVGQRAHDDRDVVVQHRDVSDEDVVVRHHRHVVHAGGGSGAGYGAGGGSGNGSGDGSEDVTVAGDGDGQSTSFETGRQGDSGSGQGQRTAESRGGSAGSLNFNTVADPDVLRGAFGPAGVGTGADYGTGGSGSGFGGRGSGSRKAMLATAGGTKHTERATTAALVWLANHQHSDGHWSLQHYVDRCKDKTCAGPGEIQSDSAATAISLLPFLAAGQTHKSRGPFKEHISKGIGWLVQQQQPDGNLAKGAALPMYSQGLAATALSEAYGLSGDRQVGEAAQRAVDYIVQAQNADGGWREDPKDRGDTSLVGWQVMALKSAHMAGLNVRQSAFTSAGKWLDAVAVNHGTEYAISPGQSPSPEMTLVGLLCRQYFGSQRNDPMLTGGMDYLIHRLPEEQSPNIYYWYCATQFMHNMGGYEWDTWNRKMRDVLVRTQIRNVDQCANGSWSPESDTWGKRGGRIAQTALATLILETYYRYLPLFKTETPDQALVPYVTAGDLAGPGKVYEVHGTNGRVTTGASLSRPPRNPSKPGSPPTSSPTPRA